MRCVTFQKFSNTFNTLGIKCKFTSFGLRVHATTAENLHIERENQATAHFLKHLLTLVLFLSFHFPLYSHTFLLLPLNSWFLPYVVTLLERKHVGMSFFFFF